MQGESQTRPMVSTIWDKLLWMVLNMKMVIMMVAIMVPSDAYTG